mgnify:CR=1
MDLLKKRRFSLQQSITFLDLTGVDEDERQEVLNSLYAENAHVQLPWKLPEHKVLHKSGKSNCFLYFSLLLIALAGK